MQKKLEEKTALITGGSRGIGAAIAKRLDADGANVAITYTKGADAAAAVVKEIERTGGKAIAIQADAADAEAVKAAIVKTVATFGRLDVLVNNAGTAIPKTFEETTLEELDRVFGDVLQTQGRLEEAQAAFGEYLAISRRLAELHPSNADWQRNLAVARSSVDNVLQAQGKLEAAQATVADLGDKYRLRTSGVASGIF